MINFGDETFVRALEERGHPFVLIVVSLAEHGGVRDDAFSLEPQEAIGDVFLVGGALQ